MAKTRREVDTAAYLLLDDIGCRVCVAWTMLTEDERVADNDDLSDRVSRLALCTNHEALTRGMALKRAGILRDDGTVDEVVMKRLRAKGAVLVGIGDEPAAEENEG